MGRPRPPPSNPPETLLLGCDSALLTPPTGYHTTSCLDGEGRQSPLEAAPSALPSPSPTSPHVQTHVLPTHQHTAAPASLPKLQFARITPLPSNHLWLPSAPREAVWRLAKSKHSIARLSGFKSWLNCLDMGQATPPCHSRLSPSVKQSHGGAAGTQVLAQ